MKILKYVRMFGGSLPFVIYDPSYLCKSYAWYLLLYYAIVLWFVYYYLFGVMLRAVVPAASDPGRAAALARRGVAGRGPHRVCQPGAVAFRGDR